MNADAMRVARHLNAMAEELNGRAQQERLKRVGRQLVPLVERSVRTTPAKSGSLADLSMSAHGRNTPWSRINITARAKVEGDQLAVSPKSQAAGPLRVLESGRKERRAGQLRSRGSRKATKNRGATTRLAVVTRNVGATEAKGTWSKATEDMADIAGRVYGAEVGRAFVQTFKG